MLGVVLRRRDALLLLLMMMMGIASPMEKVIADGDEVLQLPYTTHYGPSAT